MARLSFRCDEELVLRVDDARGDVAREKWLRRAVEAYVSLQGFGPAGATVMTSEDFVISHRPKPGSQEKRSEPQPEMITTPEVTRRAARAGVFGSKHLPTCSCGLCKPVK
jgi:hypothetical protein